MSPSEPSGLIGKLCEVGAALTWVQKRGKNTFHGYNYATEADLVLAIRLELYKRKVFLIPRFLTCKVTDFEPVAGEKGKMKYRRIVDLEIEWTWIDGETGERIVSSMPGSGEDTGDKGTYKAITGSEKYLLLKTFLLPTFDDAEQMSGADKAATQKRIVAEKTAELKAKIAAQEAQSPEEAQVELKKGKVMFITMPDRFHGEYAAVYGTAIQSEHVVAFMGDCGAQRFKAPEGIIYKLEVQYVKDCEELGKKLGFTVNTEMP